MDSITKAVIPAAGLGTRMEPLTDYLSKSMLPLGKKPVMQHVIEELKGAGISKIAIIIRSEHQSIVDYFGDDDEIQFIYDDEVTGPGGAILKAESFVEDEDFVVIFSDAPMKGRGRSDHLKRIMQAKSEKEAESVLAIYQIPETEVSSRGVVTFEKESLADNKAVRLTNIIEKPSSYRDLGRWASACRYVLSPKIFDALKNIDPDDDGELQLTPAIRSLISEGEKVFGIPLSKNLTRHDTGNFEGYFQAFADFAEND